MRKLLLMLVLLPTLLFAATETQQKTIVLNTFNAINFNQAFTMDYVAKKQIEAIEKCATNLGGDIYIVLYTPGGSISAGQLFFDTLAPLPCNFHTITIFAASMGYQTVQNLDNRYMLPSGTLMSHRASIRGLGGELDGELDSVLKYLHKNVDELEEVASKRVGLTLKEYRELTRDELWLTAKQAKEGNHIDEIVLATCDPTLLSSHVEEIRTFFGSVSVEFSDCPLITGPLNVFTNSINNVKFRDYFQNIKKRINTTL